ncbi:MAG: antibiotic biosynthesis monooxygenase [Alphaproteobacteria bacterium]|nr:antibiotic biosynthesis monooxygenase [Alphaproteobacteria bacterium]
MAHTFVARFKVHAAKETEFVAAAERLEAAVLANEPDALIYKFFRLREPHAFAVIESFATEAGDAAHQASDHFKELAPALIACIDGGWEREYLDPLK